MRLATLEKFGLERSTIIIILLWILYLIPFFFTGDIRANQNPQLTTLQVILLREHNRIADALAQLNPHWNDETIFQEARRIHIAQIQHINYYEYLPILLGKLFI